MRVNGASDGFNAFVPQAEWHSKVDFFKNGPVIVCCQMSYQISVDKPEPPKIENDIRENLWKSYQDGLYDGVTIQVEKKEFKVG